MFLRNICILEDKEKEIAYNTCLTLKKILYKHFIKNLHQSSEEMESLKCQVHSHVVHEREIRKCLLGEKELDLI